MKHGGRGGGFRGACGGGDVGWTSKNFENLVKFFQIGQVGFPSTPRTLLRTYFDQIFSDADN